MIFLEWICLVHFLLTKNNDVNISIRNESILFILNRLIIEFGVETIHKRNKRFNIP